MTGSGNDDLGVGRDDLTMIATDRIALRLQMAIVAPSDQTLGDGYLDFLPLVRSTQYF
jgi:hypothetical protein